MDKDGGGRGYDDIYCNKNRIIIWDGKVVYEKEREND